MSKISNNKELIRHYNNIYQSAYKTLKTLNVIPYQRVINDDEYIFINRAIQILTNFLQLNTITQKDIKKVIEVITIVNQDTIFDCYLLTIEKDFCNKEFNKYLQDSINYKVPKLEVFIDNGEFLKLYIEYKIEMYKEQITKEEQEKGNTLNKRA